MSGFYAGMQNTADGLLKQFGQAMTLRYITKGAYDTATGVAPESVTDATVTGAVFDIDDKRIDGSTVLRGDKRVVMSVKGVPREPVANSDRVLIQGTTHQIVAVKPLAPAGIVVTYELQVRRAA